MIGNIVLLHDHLNRTTSQAMVKWKLRFVPFVWPACSARGYLHCILCADFGFCCEELSLTVMLVNDVAESATLGHCFSTEADLNEISVL